MGKSWEDGGLPSGYVYIAVEKSPWLCNKLPDGKGSRNGWLMVVNGWFMMANDGS